MAVVQKQESTQSYTPAYNDKLGHKKITTNEPLKENHKYSQAFLLQFYKKEHCDWSRPSNRLDNYLRETLRMASNKKSTESATTSFDEFYNKMSPKRNSYNYSSLPSFPDFSPKTMPVKLNPNAKPFVMEPDNHMQYFLSKLRKQQGISPEKINKLAKIVDYWQNESKFSFRLTDIVNEDSTSNVEPVVECTTLATIYRHPIVTIARRLTSTQIYNYKFTQKYQHVTSKAKLIETDKQAVIAEWLHTLSIKERVLLKKMLDKGHSQKYVNQFQSPTSTKWATNSVSTVYSPRDFHDTPPMMAQPTYYPPMQSQYIDPQYYYHYQQPWNPYTPHTNYSMYWSYI